MDKSTMLFVLIVATIAMIWVIAKMYRRWKRDMSAEEITVRAVVVDKRSSTFRQHYNSHRRHNGMYYITFRTKDGDRVELQVSQADYMAILADAEGYLTFQGGMFRGFERIQSSVTE